MHRRGVQVRVCFVGFAKCGQFAVVPYAELAVGAHPSYTFSLVSSQIRLMSGCSVVIAGTSDLMFAKHVLDVLDVDDGKTDSGKTTASLLRYRSSFRMHAYPCVYGDGIMNKVHTVKHNHVEDMRLLPVLELDGSGSLTFTRLKQPSLTGVHH